MQRAAKVIDGRMGASSKTLNRGSLRRSDDVFIAGRIQAGLARPPDSRDNIGIG
jgi:hypothetical protein